MGAPVWALYTKPWAHLDAADLGPLVADLGFTGAEVAVRPDARVTPDGIDRALPRFVETLWDSGVATISIGTDLTERALAACAEADVPTIRVMVRIADDDYHGSVAQYRAHLETMVPLCEQYGVRVGVQPHHGRFIPSTLGVMELLEGLPGSSVGLIWDAAHDALAGERPVTTLDLAWNRLMVVNLKNARYETLPEGPGGKQWRAVFVSSGEGMAHWPTVLGHLRGRKWHQPICLTAQYTEARQDPRLAAHLVRADLAFAQKTWDSVSGQTADL